jgi:RNA-binding protein 15
LHHVAPEDDPLATRTLFAGNLEVNITDEELRRIFSRYGTVEDIDIKRPPPGTGNAYAFVRFVNLDMASRAKTELSGQYIGKFQCKIGYGKVNATTKIWVGGLGSWTTLSQLEREFDRFGSIKKIEWVKGDQNAYITYETIDASQAAVKDMRGYPLGGPDRRLRTDFADANSPPPGSGSGTPVPFTSPQKARDEDGAPGSTAGDAPVVSEAGLRSPHSGNNTDMGGTSPGSDSETGPGDVKPKVPRSKENNGTSGQSSAGLLSSARTVQEIGRRAQLGWQGALILKNSSFPTKFYLTQGHLDNVETLLKDEEGKNQLRITQRLRLDQSKLEDVLKRIATSTAHGIFLSLPSSIGSPLSSDGGAGSSAGVQSRPLRNLVSYLKQKEAAGVISLTSKDVTSSTGVLYAFPPCPFSLELLQKSSPNLEQGPDSSQAKEDHLVVVVIRGGTA